MIPLCQFDTVARVYDILCRNGKETRVSTSTAKEKGNHRTLDLSALAVGGDNTQIIMETRTAGRPRCWQKAQPE
jgi:hypothetical protein